MKSRLSLLDDPLLGFWSRRGSPELMELPHRHNELELNLIERGAILYLFPGRRIEVQAGELFFFWSAVPHQLIWKAEDSIVNWMTLPLGEVLRWGLPEAFTRLVLQGVPVVSQDETFRAGDMAAFQRWHEDLLAGEESRKRILLLEVQARLHRLAGARLIDAHQAPAGVTTDPGTGKAELMARYLSEVFQGEWHVGDVASEVGLHPNYAMTIFQRAFGVSMVEYATQLKVAMAQQLLVTTDMQILDIAFECGFGSASRFYAAFKALTSTSPRAFRESLRWKG